MAHFEWGDVESEVLAMSGPRIVELREICETLMYLSELLRKYWKLMPDAIEKDEIARVACIKFRKFGMRVQLDYADGKYVLNHTRGNHRRPPRAGKRPPLEHKIHKPQIKAAPKRAARPAAAKRPPRKTKKGQKRIVHIWHGVRGHLMAAAILAVVLWSSLRFSLSAMMRTSARALYQMTASIKAYAREIDVFVQHAQARHLARNSNLTSGAEFHDQFSAAGELRLEAMRVDWLNLTLFSFVDETPERPDWESFLFGKPPEESELVLT